MCPASAADWRPHATQDMLRLRAQLLRTLRDFFAIKNVLEVDTPVLSQAAATDPQLASFVTSQDTSGADNTEARYLHTSPEYPMKRLLAAGCGSIYQICKVFRQGENGRRHNSEFTLLEWYRVGFSLAELMDEVAELVTGVLSGRRGLSTEERVSYADAFLRYAGIEPHQATPAELLACLHEHGIVLSPTLLHADKNILLDLLLTHCVEPHLGHGRLTFIYDYPAAQAALARVRPGLPPLAERFELYLDGVELANGFYELADAAEQRRRFHADIDSRAQSGRAPVPIDERFLAALEHGLPPCAGVALGVDRLLILMSGAEDIAHVLAFPFANA